MAFSLRAAAADDSVNRVGDHVAQHEGIIRAFATHCEALGDNERAKYDRRTAAFGRFVKTAIPQRLVRFPLIAVHGGWIEIRRHQALRLLSNYDAVGVPINPEVINVTVHEADHAFCVLEDRVFE